MFPKKIETFLRGEENTFSMAVTQPWWKIDIAAINKRGQKEFTSGPDQHHLQYQSLNCWIADEISFLFDWLPPVSPDDILTKTLFDFKSFDCKQSQQHNPKALQAKNKPRAQCWYRQRQRHWRWYYTENLQRIWSNIIMVRKYGILWQEHWGFRGWKTVFSCWMDLIHYQPVE